MKYIVKESDTNLFLRQKAKVEVPFNHKPKIKTERRYLIGRATRMLGCCPIYRVMKAVIAQRSRLWGPWRSHGSTR